MRLLSQPSMDMPGSSNSTYLTRIIPMIHIRKALCQCKREGSKMDCTKAMAGAGRYKFYNMGSLIKTNSMEKDTNYLETMMAHLW